MKIIANDGTEWKSVKECLEHESKGIICLDEDDNKVDYSMDEIIGGMIYTIIIHNKEELDIVMNDARVTSKVYGNSSAMTINCVGTWVFDNDINDGCWILLDSAICIHRSRYEGLEQLKNLIQNEYNVG